MKLSRVSYSKNKLNTLKYSKIYRLRSQIELWFSLNSRSPNGKIII